jgi:hypothetical protein
MAKRSVRGHKNGKKGSCKKGGQGVLETAAVPFGLLALQRYFKGSKTSKKSVRRMGSSLKRTLRLKRKTRKSHRKH